MRMVDFIHTEYSKGEEFMDFKTALIELRESTGMTRRQFAEYFDIPYRTVQEWELGNRKMPPYLFKLMCYKVKIERLNTENQ